MTDLSFAEISRRFLDAFTYLEQSISVVNRHERGEITWLHWPDSGRRGGKYHYEFFGCNCDPAEMAQTVHVVNPKEPYFISDMYSERGSGVANYRELGFASDFQEPLMIMDLAATRSGPSRADVLEVESIALADRVFIAFQEAGDYARPTSQLQIDDPQTLIKAIILDDQPAATGKGVLLGETLYVTDIGTIATFRNRGLAAAIMTALHQSATQHGANVSILSATRMAANLYRSLGYQEIGTLDIYVPVTRN